MSEIAIKETKEQIMSGFETLLKDYKNTESKVATKEQEAEKETNKQLLETTANYTVNNIVNSMATLQLNFTTITKDISERINTESDTLDQLKKAIAVETETFKE